MSSTPHDHRSPTHSPPRARAARPGRSLWLAGLALAGALAAGPTRATVPVPVATLKGVPVPTPSNLGDFVVDRAAAIKLGKALFWDQQVGSDGKTACASCHFHAGADSRSRNQLNPGQARFNGPGAPAPDNTFQVGGVNYQFKFSDFVRLQNSNDVLGSAGVYPERFDSIGTSTDNRTAINNQPVFHLNGLSTRQVTARHAPPVVNAVFNFRQFWDGRAQYIFNGVNPHGARDANARVFRNGAGGVAPVQVRIDNASLASQAVGPVLSDVEMSAAGRNFMHVGKRVLAQRPLAFQPVSPSDSQLGGLVHSSGLGLSVPDYASLVRQAFRPEWWGGAQAIQVDAAGNKTVVPMPASLGANQFNQMQANFSLFFGLALQLYQSTLVADDTPFDRYAAGDASAMTPQAIRGLAIFNGKANCAACHGDAEMTNASVRRTVREPLQRMPMADGSVKVYDQGFYNIGARQRIFDDIHNGATDPFGRPLSLTGIARQFGSAGFQQLIGIAPNIAVAAGEPIAVMGAAKTPHLRNVALSAPFLHNGSEPTLREVVEMYNRGGNFRQANLPEMSPDVRPLGLTHAEMDDLVAFMMHLTDERVALHKAPFDGPGLTALGNGHQPINNGLGQAVTDFLVTAVSGAGGLPSAPMNFLDIGPHRQAMTQATLKIDEQSATYAKGTGQLTLYYSVLPAQVAAGNRVGLYLRGENTALVHPITAESAANRFGAATLFFDSLPAGDYDVVVVNSAGQALTPRVPVTVNNANKPGLLIRIGRNETRAITALRLSADYKIGVTKYFDFEDLGQLDRNFELNLSGNGGFFNLVTWRYEGPMFQTASTKPRAAGGTTLIAVYANDTRTISSVRLHAEFRVSGVAAAHYDYQDIGTLAVNPASPVRLLLDGTGLGWNVLKLRFEGNALRGY